MVAGGEMIETDYIMLKYLLVINTDINITDLLKRLEKYLSRCRGPNRYLDEMDFIDRLLLSLGINTLVAKKEKDFICIFSHSYRKDVGILYLEIIYL